MPAKAKPKPKPITILPREPLTNKARKAINAYVEYYGEKKGPFIFVLIEATLKAERMRRADLYEWLAKHGYSWNGVYWSKKDTPTPGNLDW